MEGPGTLAGVAILADGLGEEEGILAEGLEAVAAVAAEVVDIPADGLEEEAAEEQEEEVLEAAENTEMAPVRYSRICWDWRVGQL